MTWKIGFIIRTHRGGRSYTWYCSQPSGFYTRSTHILWRGSWKTKSKVFPKYFFYYRSTSGTTMQVYIILQNYQKKSRNKTSKNSMEILLKEISDIHNKEAKALWMFYQALYQFTHQHLVCSSVSKVFQITWSMNLLHFTPIVFRANIQQIRTTHFCCQDKTTILHP